jgi:hypothetical protein
LTFQIETARTVFRTVGTSGARAGSFSTVRIDKAAFQQAEAVVKAVHPLV